MNRDAGTGAVLSFVVIALVAVAFHRPEAPAVALEPRRHVEAVAPPRRSPMPAPTPGVPIPEGPPDPPRAAPSAERADRPIRPASRRRLVRRPSSAFALVEEGETLADVARRIYGSEDDVESLRCANRDRLGGQEAEVHAGMLLRTP